MTFRIFALSISLVLAFAAAALAQDGGKGALRQACRGDVRALCAGIQPGGGRILQCLRDHADKLSDGCKQALQAAKAAKQSPKQSH